MQKAEKIKQHNLVKWFSQEYPKYYGHLFAVNNDTFGIKDAAFKKAIGLIPGVSDLIFMVPKKGVMCGIEIKAPDSYHTIEHIENQLKWGMNLITNKGFYIMTSNIDACKIFISGIIECQDSVYSSIQFKAYQLVKEKLQIAKEKGRKNIRF